MNQHETLLLEALKASLSNKIPNWDQEFSKETWNALFSLAESHKVLPLVVDSALKTPAAHLAPAELMSAMKRRSHTLMFTQIQKTAQFLNLYQTLQAHKITPLVVKGLVCRELYPKSDLRLSSDEDLLVAESDFEKAIEVLKSCGLRLRAKVDDLSQVTEVGMISDDGISYIELHKYLFSPNSDSFENYNTYFTDSFKNCTAMQIQGTTIYTLEPEMHLFYLICHALKHFLHSGFGIRQICDIVLFANAYGSEIDWQKLLTDCKELHAEKFTAAIFQIGKKYLTFDEERACYPKQWQEIEIDETELLLEVLESGIYGGSTMSRRHSSKMTLDAATASKLGKKKGNAMLSAAFPPAKDLEGRYPYLKEKPYLLPLAWTRRFMAYYREIRLLQNNTATEAVKIGNKRIELLKKYGIIK